MKISYLARSVQINLMSILKSSPFALAVMLCFASLFAEIINPIMAIVDTGIRDYGDAYFFHLSTHFGYYIYAAPLVCAFATGNVFCDDWEAGFYRHRLMKVGRRVYKHGLWVGVTLGGGLAVMLGVLIFALVCTLSFGPLPSATILPTMDAWLPLLQGAMGSARYMIINALLGFLFGMVWSGVGLLISTFTPNRYVSFLAPFMVCFSAVIFLPASLGPLEMLVQMNWESFTFPKLVAYQLILYTLLMIGHSIAFDRRINRE